jgi:putative peptidoglycan lipid II flippase
VPEQSPLPNVARASGIMMVSLTLSRVLGILRDTIMVGQFGKGAQTDAYVLAFQIPDLIFFLIAGGALSSAFIPVFSEYWHTNRKDEAWRLFGAVTAIMSVALLAIIAIAWVFATPLTMVLAPGKDPALVPLIAEMGRIVLPAQFAFFIGGLMIGTLYARQRFLAPGLGPNVYNIGIILGALVLSQFFSPGIKGMAWGALGGAFIGSFLIPLIVMRRLGSPFRPSFDLRHEGVRKVFRLMAPVVFGLSLPGVYGLIMRGFGSYYPDGVNTALDLANKLMHAPLGVFGQSFALAVFPALTQFFAQGRMDLYREQCARTLRTTLYVGLPVSALLLVLAHDVVAAVLQYGRFGAADTAVVARSLQWFSLGIAAWCLHPILMRAYFSMHRSVKPIVMGTVATAIFVGLAFVLGWTPLGFYSLPLASSISAIVLALMMLIALRKDAGGLDLAGIAATFGKGLLGAVAAGLVVYAGASLLPTGEGLGLGRNAAAFARLAVLGISGIWVYYGVTRALGMPETAYINRALGRLAARRGTRG